MPSTQLSYKNISLQLSLAILSGIGVLWFVIYKASHTSFTHDESYTYTHYVHQGFMDIISYKTPYTNNHILNTVFMKYSEVFFGSLELSLRLPNILAFIIYSVFSILLLYKYIPKLIFPFYLLMVLNPHLLDFFALARGYGLSFAFLMMSFYYLSLYFTSKQNKYLILFNVGAFLAVMSNFSLLNYYVAALIVHNMVSYIMSKIDPQENPYHFYQQNKINILSVLLSGMVLYEPLRRISKMSLLDFGGKNGFMEDTVGTAIYSFFYDMNVTPFYETILKGLILLIVGLILAIALKAIIQRNINFLKSNISLVLINSILLAIVVITIVQHLVLGNDYYIHRFALFFYPLFILNVVFLLNYSVQSFKITGISCSYSLASLALLNIYINHNITSYKDWKIDCDVKTMMQKLILEHEKSPSKQIRLGINWLFEPSTNFYRYTWNLKWLNPTHRRGVNKNDDYLYVLKTDKEFAGLADRPILHLCEETGAVLLKNTP